MIENPWEDGKISLKKELSKQITIFIENWWLRLTYNSLLEKFLVWTSYMPGMDNFIFWLKDDQVITKNKFLWVWAHQTLRVKDIAQAKAEESLAKKDCEKKNCPPSPRQNWNSPSCSFASSMSTLPSTLMELTQCEPMMCSLQSMPFFSLP